MSVEQEMVDGMADMMLNAMKNKKALIAEFVGAITNNLKYQNGLESFIKAVDEGKTNNAQLGQMLRTMAKVQKSQANTLRQLSMMALVHVSSGEFDSEAVQVANKLGKGQETLQETFKQKLGD